MQHIALCSEISWKASSEADIVHLQHLLVACLRMRVPPFSDSSQQQKTSAHCPSMVTLGTHLPLLMEGRATVFKCFSSASFSTFSTAVFSCCCALESPHDGLLTWITYLAGNFFPGHIAAETQELFPLAMTFYNSCDFVSFLSAMLKWQNVLLIVWLLLLLIVNYNEDLLLPSNTDLWTNYHHKTIEKKKQNSWVDNEII